MGLQLELAKTVAKKFSLRDDETKIFNELWELKRKSDDFEKDREDDLHAEIDTAFDTFSAVVNGGSSTRPGHSRVERRPIWNKYVIFSDHHMAYSGHRHNFFASSGNRSLYTKLLPEYFNKNYTLVEAGDVEELIIYEPTQAEADRRTKLSWTELNTRRVDCRTEQLRKILNDSGNAALYGQLAQFSRAGRLVRVAGNHDYDLQKEPLLDLLQAKLPEIERPCDYLLLGTQQMTAPGDPEKWATKVDYAILHGHQFDKFANPRFAPQLGETISECLAWGYQGADRVWRWNDKVSDWAFGRRSFSDNLVTDDYERPSLIPINLEARAFWEWLFKHNIAWEYFESDTSTGAIVNEVLKGEEFFKFRHLNEVFIRKRMVEEFPDASSRPKLVLGHSHEPRFKPAVPSSATSWSTYEHYFNTAAAGRFENLIWALEIVGGTPTLVSWSFAGGPRDTASAAQRRVWSVNDVAPGSTLRANINPADVP
jgi:hypothetical protein